MELKCTLVLFGLFLISSESRECDIGFHKANKGCVDDDECEMPGLCGENAQCFNTNGSYYCTCDEGFQSNPSNFTATTGQCIDINECLAETRACSEEKECVNALGTYSCLCPKGYRDTRLDSACEDINECLDADVCGTNADCYNHPGSYSCKCHQGYSNYGNNQSKCITMEYFCQ